MKNKEGYVYLIWTGTDYFKIGRTNNPEKRLKAHRTSNHLVEGFTALFHVEDMYLAETLIKRRFEKYMVDNREWYELPISELEELEKKQLILKIKEINRQLEIKTLALVNTKNENNKLKTKLKKYDKIVIENIKKLKEDLENAKYN